MRKRRTQNDERRTMEVFIKNILRSSFLVHRSLLLLLCSSFIVLRSSLLLWAEFEDLPVGAWGASYGGATTALTQDALSPFHNPAGLGPLTGPEISGGVARYFGARGRPNLSDLYFGYAVPREHQSVLGITWLSLRQTGVFGRDVLGVSLSKPYESDYLHAPLYWGATVKMQRVQRKDSSGSSDNDWGLGIEGGVSYDVLKDMSLGLTLRELNMPSLDLGGPLWKLGLSKRFRQFTLAGDFSLRQGLLRFLPGVGINLFHGLLETRFGKAFALDGSDQLAMGFGLKFSPVTIDYAATFPFRGFHDTAGSHEITLNYRFGAPHFYVNFLGHSREYADQLQRQIKELEGKKKDLEQAVEKTQYDLGAAKQEHEQAKTQEQITLQEAETAKKKLEAERIEAEKLKQVRSILEKDIAEKKKKVVSAPAPAPVPKSAVQRPSLPARHVVKAGETLRSLAKKYYGDEKYWDAIYRANSEKIQRGVPKIGTELLIPKLD